MRNFLALLFGLLIGLAVLAASHKAWSRDNGQWGNVDPIIRGWYASLVQPDTLVSCCGESDAYWADEYYQEDGKVIAVITDDQDDELLKRAHVPIGTRFVIPANKLVDATKQRGNPTGHTIIFLGTIYGDGRSRPVLCFVLGGGT